MKNISNFELTSQYNQAQLERPHVSLTQDDYEIHYDPMCVEIGGVKWATKNVGAKSITDYGLYFQWGDSTGYTSDSVGTTKHFDYGDTKYIIGTDGDTNNYTITKYNETDNKIVLDSIDDGATQYLGKNWRTPTIEEWKLLKTSTTSIWVTNYLNSGVNGRLFTDKNDSSKKLFLPAAGNCVQSSFSNLNTQSLYQSSSLNATHPIEIYMNLFDSSRVVFSRLDRRIQGFSVRPIYDPIDYSK